MTLSCAISGSISEDFIVRNPAILDGTPCIRGTRLNIYAIAARLTGDETAEDIVRENPWVTVEMVHAAVEYAAQHPLVEHPDARPWRKPVRKPNAA